MNRFAAVAVLVLSSCGILLAAEQPATPEQISQWVKDLGSDDFDTRQKAEALLIAAGLEVRVWRPKDWPLIEATLLIEGRSAA